MNPHRPLLADITRWESYYDNCSRITPPASGPLLAEGDVFSFSTFGLDPLPSQVFESVAPGSDLADPAGRLAWRAGPTGSGKTFIEVYHAWVVEDLSGGRMRVLTQESQIGQIAADLARQVCVRSPVRPRARARLASLSLPQPRRCVTFG